MSIAMAAAVLGAPALATAQSADNISFKVDKERSIKNKVIVGSLGGAAAVFVGVGVLFNLDSKDKSDQVSSGGAELTGDVWTPEREEIRKGALRSRNYAIATYSVGGALALATAIYYIATDPGEELVTVPPGSRVTRGPTLTPVDGGAVVGARWSWQ